MTSILNERWWCFSEFKPGHVFFRYQVYQIPFKHIPLNQLYEMQGRNNDMKRKRKMQASKWFVSQLSLSILVYPKKTLKWDN